MNPVKVAYLLGAVEAQRDFEKQAGILDRIPGAAQHALGGAAVGGSTGALLAGEEDRGKGALIGALLGGAGGAAKLDDVATALGYMGKMPVPRSASSTALIGGLGGAVGGITGRAFKRDREINESSIRRLLNKESAALGDPMYWQGGQEAMAPEGEGAPAPTAEDAALQLPPGIFQGLQMKVNPAGERSTTVKVTPDALQTPDTLAGIFQAEPNTKVEMSIPQASSEGAGSGPSDMGIPQGGPVDGAGALPPPKMAQIIAKVAEKTRIESESNPDVHPLYPWTKKTMAERNAAKIRQMQS